MSSESISFPESKNDLNRSVLDEEKLVDAVDGFCENIGFTRAQIEKVFRTAQALGLPVNSITAYVRDAFDALGDALSEMRREKKKLEGVKEEVEGVGKVVQMASSY